MTPGFKPVTESSICSEFVANKDVANSLSSETGCYLYKHCVTKQSKQRKGQDKSEIHSKSTRLPFLLLELGHSPSIKSATSGVNFFNSDLSNKRIAKRMHFIS